jgi:hypothetical protein
VASRSRFTVYFRAQAEGGRSGWLLARVITEVTVAAVTVATMVLVHERLEISPVMAEIHPAPRALAEDVPETITQPQLKPAYPEGCNIDARGRL